MDPTTLISTGVPPATLILYLKARNQRIFRCSRRPNISCSSTSKPPKPSASPFHHLSSLALTRWSSESEGVYHGAGCSDDVAARSARAINCTTFDRPYLRLCRATVLSSGGSLSAETAGTGMG